MQKQKIRIRLKAFDYKLIDQSALEIVDTASRTGVWSGSLVMELLCAVPILCAVPALFREIATSAMLHGRAPNAVDVPLGASEVLPALAVVAFMLYQLCGFGTLNYVLTRRLNWAINLAIAALIFAAYAANWIGAYAAERTFGSILMVGMVGLVWYSILRLCANTGRLRRAQSGEGRKCSARGARLEGGQ